jgi:hypothetical protein
MQNTRMDAEKRRELWSVAQRNGWSARSAAIACGLGEKGGKAIDAAIRRGSQRGKVAPAFDAWLLNYAGTLAAAGEKVPELRDEARGRFNFTADELTLLARFLRSVEYSPEEKARKFKSFVFDAAVGLGLIDK